MASYTIALLAGQPCGRLLDTASDARSWKAFQQPHRTFLAALNTILYDLMSGQKILPQMAAGLPGQNRGEWPQMRLQRAFAGV
ncbi:MAG: hypothetical protein BAA04_10990 [Firmicutes bacterium ZCTH02-B6]|nr:MAG: hypothetical protein BAA04_10990 [Firmicutes bacterium ZCTH02-B6]